MNKKARRGLLCMLFVLMAVSLCCGAGSGVLAAQKADLNYVHVYENRQDATNTVAVGQTGTGVQLKGDLANARSVLVIDEAMSLGDAVQFTMSLNYDAQGIGDYLNDTDYFALLFMRAEKIDGAFAQEDFFYAGKAGSQSGSGMMLRAHMNSDLHQNNRAALTLSSCGQKEIFNGDSTYGGAGTDIALFGSDACIDFAWALTTGAPIVTELKTVGEKFVMSFRIDRTPARPDVTVYTIETDASSLIEGDYYVAFEIANLDGTVRAVDFGISDVSVTKAEPAGEILNLKDNHADAENNVSVTSEEGVHTVSGTLKNSRSVVVLNNPLSVGDVVSFDLRLNFDTTAIEGGSHKTNDYFAVIFAEGQYLDNGEMDPNAFSFKNNSGNGAMFQTYLMGAEKGQGRADLNFSTYTKKDIVNGDSVYGFSGSQYSDAYNDLGWSFANNKTIHVEIGVEKIGGVDYFYYLMPDINRENGVRYSTAKFMAPLSDVVTTAAENSFFLAFELANLDATSRNADFTVSNVKVEKLSLSVTPDSIFLKPGQQTEIRATLAGSEEAVRPTYVSADENVATVDENGKVTAIGAGTTEITADYNGSKGKTYVTVANNITLNLDALTLVEGQTAGLSAITNPNGLEVEYSSSDESVVTVDEGGLVTAVGTGSAKIIARIVNFTEGELLIEAECEVTVSSYTQPENVYGEEYNILYSQGAITEGETVEKTAKGYEIGGKLVSGRYLLSFNTALTFEKAVTFDFINLYDVDGTSDETRYDRYFGVFIGCGDSSEITEEAFMLGGSDGAGIQLSANAGWWAWGGKQLLAVSYGANQSVQRADITTGSDVTLDTPGVSKYASAFARMFNAAGRIQVRIEKVEDQLVVSFTPIFSEGTVPDGTEGLTYPDGNANEYIGPYSFSFAWSDVENTASGQYYLAVGFGNHISGSSSNMNCRLENINFGALNDVQLNIQSRQMKKGDTYRLTASLIPNSYIPAETKWESSNPLVAAVDNDGLVTAVGSGKTVLTYTADGKSASCEIVVIGGLTLTEKSQTLEIGASFTLTVATDPVGMNVTFASSDDRIATVDGNGKVTAVKEGSVKIYVRIGSLFEEICEVTVSPAGQSGGCGSSISAYSAVLAVLILLCVPVLIKKYRQG